MWKDKGVDGDAQRLAQIVFLLFLKVFDHKEEERELMDDTVRYLKELIAIRQKYDCFCDEQAFIGFESYYGALIYRIDNLTIFINPGSEDILYDDGFERRIIFANERTRDSRGTLVDVSPYSIVICENE